MLDTMRKIQQVSMIIGFAAIYILTRVLPHHPDFTAQIAFVAYIAYTLPKPTAACIVFLVTFISDVLLSIVYGYPMVGLWSLFTYSGILAMVYFIPRKAHAKLRFNLLLISLFGAFGYWLWSNFGTWLLSGIYYHNLSSLIECYTMALPFLQHSINGALFWSLMLIISQEQNFKLVSCKLYQPIYCYVKEFVTKT